MKKYSVIREAIHKMLQEANWNFHYGKNHDGRPYKSETKFVCQHDTGQFGSGTYFSTYNTDYGRTDAMQKYGYTHPNQDPKFIQIDDGVYRVDFNLYKNLYRVFNERQGNVLHTMMSWLNGFYSMISGGFHCEGMPYDKKRSNFDTRIHYQIISRNAEALGLNCPSYIELIRMAQEHANSDKTQSFSTVFMEYNGYNGVNVSGVDIFDTSTHGSVIYDLSKVSLERQDPHWLKGDVVGSSRNHSISSKFLDFKDRAMAESLLGKFEGYYYKQMTNSEKITYVKNVLKKHNFPSAQDIKWYIKEDEHICNYIFKYAFNHADEFAKFIYDYDMVELITKLGLTYYINFNPTESPYQRYRRKVSFLEEFLSEKRWGLDTKEEKEEYLNQLLSQLNRPLTDEEKEYINDYYFQEGY